jgi:hypothetical protein
MGTTFQSALFKTGIDLAGLMRPNRDERATCSPPKHSARHLGRLHHACMAEDEDGRDQGLDRTLGETFPCSDPLSSIPNPYLERARTRRRSSSPQSAERVGTLAKERTFLYPKEEQ